jgi:hypothetical protein
MKIYDGLKVDLQFGRNLREIQDKIESEGAATTSTSAIYNSRGVKWR